MDVREIRKILSDKNNAIVVSTDTVYGILSTSIETIERIKGRRPGEKKIVKLIGKIERMGENIPEDLLALAEGFWPGPLTIIYGGVGYRIPDDGLLLEILGEMEFAYASSANVTGGRTVESLEEAREIFEGEGIFFVENKNQRRRTNLASTVFDYDNKKIIREGNIKGEDIFSRVRST